MDQNYSILFTDNATQSKTTTPSEIRVCVPTNSNEPQSPLDNTNETKSPPEETSNGLTPVAKSPSAAASNSQPPSESPPEPVERIIEVQLIDREEKKRRLLSKFASIKDDDEDTFMSADHMFVRGIPRANEPSRVVQSIVTRFNSTETCSSADAVPSRRFDSRQTLKFTTKNIFGQTFDNHEEVEMRSGVPWTVTSRRVKFRISSLSRDVPFEMPNHHKGFIVDEGLRDGKNAESLLHFLEKCVIKNQN